MNLKEIIISATVDVFDTMVMMKAEPGEPLPEKITSFTGNVSGMLGFSGDIKGTLSVHCPDGLAKAITAALLFMEIDEIAEIDEDVKDTVGELTNMVTGGVKTALAEEGKDLELSIPTVIGGRSYSLSSMADTDWVIVPFEVEGERLLIELQFMLTN